MSSETRNCVLSEGLSTPRRLLLGLSWVFVSTWFTYLAPLAFAHTADPFDARPEASGLFWLRLARSSGFLGKLETRTFWLDDSRLR